MIAKTDLVRRVLAVLNDIERDYAYDPSNTPRYIEELFPAAWRTLVTLCPPRWLEPRPLPLTKRWEVTLRTDAAGRVELPELPDDAWEVTETSYDEESGVVTADVRIETGQVRDLEDGSGYVILPEDFLCLYRFRLRGWHVAAHRAYEEDDHVAALQSNPYTRGTPQRPVVVVKPCEVYTFPPERDGVKPDIHDWGIRSGYALWYYSVPAGRRVGVHDVVEASYVADLLTMPREVPVAHEAVAPLVYLLAARVFLSMEKIEQSNRLMQSVTEMIDVEKR